MADLQQQVADGSRPIARVGDVIEHGQDIPANVRTVEDAYGDVHRRHGASDLWGMNERAGDNGENEDGEDYVPWTSDHISSYGPLTVVEVDPEPQAAEPGCPRCGTILNAAAAHCADPWHHDNQAAESGPVVLSLPQGFEVPQPSLSVTRVMTASGRIVVRMGGDHWLNSDTAKLHAPDAQVGTGWNNLLASHGRLTDATPPREPRVWRVDIPAEPDDVMEVTIHLGGAADRRFERGAPHLWHEVGGSRLNNATWCDLFGLGDVREVIEP